MGQGQMVEFRGALNPARDDVGPPAATGRGYFVKPGAGSGPGVLLMHAWWGLNEVVRQWANDLAGTGFAVLAPDLFGGRVAATPDEAEALATGVEGEESAQIALEQQALGAADHLAQLAGAPVAVVGFSFGAAYGLWLSRKRPDTVSSLVLFYGTGGPPGDGRSRVLGHFAENDPFESAESVDELELALRAAGRLDAFHRYPGTGHWFAEPDRPEFDEHAAELAWQRTHDFLARMFPR